ncbi:MAG: hypothetical protein KatS3mg032_1651 [Cyclobacteriaceae bacterium]|nr:MAG: hypothetical protein KatS3mg032_1651 [Cyclobacteriaceae bacterium]
MLPRARIVQLLIGPADVLPAFDYKSAWLRALLSLLSIKVAIFYFIADCLTGVQGNYPFYLLAIAAGVACLILNRLGYFLSSSVVFLLTINLTVFVFADNDPHFTGIYTYFICTALTAFALLGYRHPKLAAGFSLLSLALFLLAYWTDLNLVKREVVPLAYAQLYLTINFLASFFTCLFIIYFLIDVNRYSESILLKQNTMLEKANAELDQFAYSVSHDLRAPLSSILGLINVYRLSQNTEEQQHIISLISGRVQKLDEFIRDVLNHSRNMRMEVNYEPVKLHALVQEELARLSHMKDFGKQKIENHVPEDFQVNTDRSRLQIILSNLISNAVKYYDPAKPEPFIRIQAEKSTTQWKLTIADNGVGIEESHKKNLFTMFYRAHNFGEGSGLGLYIVKEICQKMGGTVQVSSQYGAGTEFTVTLPLTCVAK